MAIRFEDALIALRDGLSVRRKRWEPTTKLTVEDGELMQSNPRWKDASPMQFDWEDITASDWQILPEAA